MISRAEFRFELTRHGLLVAVAACLVALSACSTGNDRGAAGENYAYLPGGGWYQDPDTGEVTRRWLGPIAEQRLGEDGRREFALRPLVSTMSDPVTMEREFLALWPLFQDSASYRDYGDMDDRVRKRRIWLFPVFLYNEFSAIPGEYEYDYFAPFPIVIGGYSTREGSHFALVPLGGTLKGLLGQDEITFLGGPLYVKAREGESTTWHLPWPLIRYGEGPRYLTHAVLPLYGYSRQDGDYERYRVLWPLVSWGEDQLGTRWPRKYWMALPFASRSWTAGSEMVSVIPPFFNYMRIEQSNTTLIDAPWPIFRVASGDSYNEFRIWPLYRRIELGDDTETNVVWPFFWHFDDREPGWRESRVWFLPIWFSRDRVYDATADGTRLTDGGWDLWPLARSRRKVDGAWTFQFPAPLPPLGERFERSYGSIFRWVYLEGEPGRHNTEILWGFIKSREDETGSNFSVFPFYWNESNKAPVVEPSVGERDVDEVVETAEDSKEWRVLGGLVGRKKAAGKTTIRLLWFITFDV